MVKVAVIGSTGNSGSRIVTELLQRGHEVRAIARNPEKVTTKHDKLTVVQGDVTAGEDLSVYVDGVDVAVNAFAPPMENVGLLVTVTENLVKACGAANVRLIMVGGAGGLSLGEAGRVIDQPWFPAAWLGIAQAHIDALEILRASSINWTTLTPPTYFIPGERTGVFQLGLENLLSNAAGEAKISMEDYAIAIADEIENPKHERLRFTIGYA